MKIAASITMLMLIAGCAGHTAMVIKRPPPQEKCEVRVCEDPNLGEGRCWREYCSTAGDILGRM